MNNTTFVYGSEVQGRGYATDMDIAFGIVTTLIGITACTGGVLNLYLIKNLKAFHNAFGFFWVVRTIGELGTDLTFLLYTGPVTVLQPTNIPPALGIFVYHLSYTFAYMQCLMNLIIAWNRFVAVWFPMNYLRVFNAKLCGGVAIYVCCQACIVTTLFFNILMTIVLLSIILCNNQKDLGLLSIVLSYDGLILIYCFNTGSMVLCNPECRRFLFGTRKGAVSNTYATGTGAASNTAAPSDTKHED
ncbi:hypothetical protein QR680_015484 [Steinernema hermaphroditum]|uniref:7TM GPCR serpentine receptor class x (Srx) domain-containing protein n=1 Tax=Steinernema hermaphroditum TaxID=289476 RepID=A0AA39LKB0_9BILA|nr:hypothetical protein QR680_015484 [Steinernema hermaphroditum]